MARIKSPLEADHLWIRTYLRHGTKSDLKIQNFVSENCEVTVNSYVNLR
jgi:hypothetical protein